VVCPSGRDPNGRVAYAHLTFQQLDRESDRLAHGLQCAGIGRGTRTILMVRPALSFSSSSLPYSRSARVPVVVDPGMGIRRMLACYPFDAAAGLYRRPPRPCRAHPLSPVFQHGANLGHRPADAGSGGGSP